MDVMAGFFMVLGAALVFIAGIGVARSWSIYARMHSVAIAPTLGVISVAIGLALSIRSMTAFVTALLVVILLLVTGPVGSHLLTRAVYRQTQSALDSVDELARDECSDS